MELCEHLAPIAEHLAKLGIVISERYTDAWGLHAVMNGPADQDGVPKGLVSPPVEPWTDIQVFFFPTQGFVCSEHRHSLGWRMTDTQIQETLAKWKERDSDRNH